MKENTSTYIAYDACYEKIIDVLSILKQKLDASEGKIPVQEDGNFLVYSSKCLINLNESDEESDVSSMEQVSPEEWKEIYSSFSNDYILFLEIFNEEDESISLGFNIFDDSQSKAEVSDEVRINPKHWNSLIKTLQDYELLSEDEAKELQEEKI